MMRPTTKTRILIRWCLSIGFAAVAAAGCAGTPARPSTPMNVISLEDQTPVHSPSRMAPSATALADPAPVEQRIRAEVLQWEGTSHRMGGTSRHGIDCSGFVQRLYRDLFNRRTPRSTALQVQSGQGVDKAQLRSGDLVFFKTPHKGRHVGIYLGQREFAHASTRRGVTISRLDDRYWHQSYWTARRYLVPIH